MTAAAKSVPGNPAAHRKSLITLLELASRRRHLWEVFGDFVEMGALAMANSVDLNQFAEREARYLALIQRYEPDEQKLFPKMLGELVLAMEYGPDDVLGRVFGELDLGNAARGQFFTPYHVCVAMARLQVGDGTELRERIKQRGFIRLNEPAAGAGALVIAMAEAMQHQQINYQQHLHVIAQDVDSRAVHMAYLQLSLLHIPAVVILGNTLALEEREHWYTPAHILGLWSPKLRRGFALGSAMDERQDETAPAPEAEPAPPYIPQPLPAPGAQMALF
jgi:hypothetical protein